MGFSGYGLAVGLAVLAPNLVLLWAPRREGLPEARVPTPLLWLERLGQALCLVVSAVAVSDVLRPWWLVPLGLALAGYLALWVRYLRGGRRAALLFGSWRRVPVPMAILPVVVFLCAAGWLGNPWLALAALILAAGHIPVSLRTARVIAAGEGGASGEPERPPQSGGGGPS